MAKEYIIREDVINDIGEDYLLMCRSIYSIEVHSDSITVYTVDGNSSNITISAKEEQ